MFFALTIWFLLNLYFAFLTIRLARLFPFGILALHTAAKLKAEKAVPDQEYERQYKKLSEYIRRHTPSSKESFASTYVNARRRRFLLRINRTPQQEIEYRSLVQAGAFLAAGFWSAIMSETRRIIERIIPKVLVMVAIAVISGLTFLAHSQALGVTACKPPKLFQFGISGIRGDPATVSGVDATNLGMASGRLMLLGRRDRTYVLYNCDQGRTIRMPASDKVTVTTSG
jgi:hypothetical protein